jgi:DNA-binding transcriptional MerR regulator
VASNAKPHGHFLAGEAGELAGVSGNTIGQWARWGYIRSSASDAEPRGYGLEDVVEAVIVGELLRRGVPHADIRRAIKRLGAEYEWPLSAAPLATTPDGHLVLLRENGEVYALSARGWQLMTAPPELEEIHLRLRRG